ncbi:LytR C-terminal domain-containing protein [Corynebacterium coyleae]|uniref:LytR C-terminal domain-containing protein n=1 Tax=Corynebacterium coyleae TaxID=53374 RepID=UPI00254ED5F4|nr:LytR C-terminal domain-containing protein [Corynebacterium coyleae]MDK8664349.1 LytR C-terminal domain-containing protein [Corynebacterium coyleae]MDK8707623.1 LytR C-terminal domain-containing protein [Corynebacterium coyleae]MDK8734469.1 LytR C-terminal domain-containing protein [Corynebacterium coyleae]MDK8893456.1 LytR C-terminal domain-containing protein [Corynebacterium coyleae]
MTKDQYGNDPRYDNVGDEPLDAEIIDDTPTDAPAEEYRGAHRRDDDADYDYDEAYDEAYAGYAAGAGAGSTAVTAGGAGAAGAGAGAGAAAAQGGLPRRGLAMILIAVAALLLLWALWAMTQKGDDNNAASSASSETSTSATAEAAPSAAQPGEGQGQGTQDPNASQDPNSPQDPNAEQREGDQAQDPNAQDPNAQDPNAETPAPAPVPAPQGAQLDNASAQVFVYNNSGIADLANRTADQLKGQFNVANQSQDAATMNMPEQQYGIFPETYVFFDPATPGAEQVAADIARRVGGTARAKNDIPEGAVGLPEQAANNRSAVAVVLAG